HHLFHPHTPPSFPTRRSSDLYHVPVQGEGSAEQIAQALDQLNRHREKLGGIDVILLARGGGSLEDLWEFNEEILARAIARCKIPDRKTTRLNSSHSQISYAVF